MANYKVNTIEQFWKLVDQKNKDECWEWLGVKANGYGSFSLKLPSGPEQRANRIALILGKPYEFTNRKMFCCHTCDNPACCNPSHLYWGTPKDNARDAITRGRGYMRMAVLNDTAIKPADLENLIETLFKSHKDFACQIGVHPNTVSNWVKGNRRIPIVVVQYLNLKKSLQDLSQKR